MKNGIEAETLKIVTTRIDYYANNFKDKVTNIRVKEQKEDGQVALVKMPFFLIGELVWQELMFWIILWSMKCAIWIIEIIPEIFLE